jgi:signal transduction histidine kinase
MPRQSGRLVPNATLLLTICLAVATVLMFVLGYRATREWDRSTRESAQSRGNEVLALLSVALERDMKGGQINALLPFNQRALEESSLYDLADRFAGLFARFPYLESIFVWKGSNSPRGVTYFFNRAERLPPWDDEASAEDPYPVIIRVDPPPVRLLVNSILSRASTGAAFVLVQTDVDRAPYQALVNLLYSSVNKAGLSAAVGFTVNLEWVRQHYFADLINQVAKIGGDPTIRIEIRDQANAVVAQTGPEGTDAGAVKSDVFPLVFSDRGLLSHSATGAPIQTWRARVDVSRSATLLAARSGSTNTLELLAFGACVAMVALVLTVRASRAAGNLALRQSEFVAAVTHEMKTPLSLITLTSDSLAHGRYASLDTIRDYGRLIGVEAHNLTRLVDNVLCYARLVEARSAYSFETVDLIELVSDSMERFRLQVEDAGCDVHLDLPLVAPPIEGDRGMLQDALDNLIDNALKHGGSGYLLVKVRSVARQITIEVTDRGEGIAAEDLARVFDKFYRGRATRHRGSGLGLTIARRIIEEHGGTIAVRSTAGQGTSVIIELPQAPGESGRVGQTR